ncbi:hypothetical protein NX722_13845 [Endozoicomonas gorgoniicola]|uniref:Uncharacterized protein n=1 Tax=Endozoicomonas gorgoniicola TaxID=1234144 RepID=A0ABT3MWD0_9GAMM|nr:hypothetical protein [Endozoicomonas gorgoniicola]MCW7553692.1 hypothetical protein [Endozoicomonas gorgoniicola]
MKTVEQKEKELIDKLERTIPGSVPVLQDALRQDVLNPIYLFIADELGITPKPSSQVYSVEVTAINQDEFKVESKARFTRYTKPGVNKSNEGETTIHVQSHFKRDNGAFVPSWLSTDIQLNGIKAKHLKTQPKMKRAKSADALREVKGNLISSLSPQRPASTVMADSLLRWNEGIFCGATSLNGSKATRPASHFFPFTPVERQISQQRGATQKLTLTQVDGQLYATNMPQTELEQRIQEKTTIRDYKKSLHEAQKVWDSPPRASSMSIPHPLNQTSAQLSKLITNRPTPDFFEQNKKGIIASTPGTITTMKQADLAYKNLWLNKANELSQGSSDHAYHLVIHSLPSLTLQGEKVAQFVELSSKLKIMSNAMVKLSEEAREAKEVFSRKAINQKQLLGWLLKIKTESSEQLKKLRGSGCEFSTLCEQYGFYKNQSPVDGYQNAAQYLEEQKKRVILEEKKLMAAVMIATIESKDTVPGSDTLPGYDDYAKFINDMAVYDKNGSATPLVSHMLGNSKRFNGYKLFDNEGNFRLPEQLVKEVEAQAIEKLVKEVEAQAIEKLAMYETKNPEAKICKGWRV